MEAYLSSPERTQSSLPLQGDFASGMRTDPGELGVRGDSGRARAGAPHRSRDTRATLPPGFARVCMTPWPPATSRSDCEPPMRKRAPDAGTATCERMGS